jgi:hypothetical protein
MERINSNINNIITHWVDFELISKLLFSNLQGLDHLVYFNTELDLKLSFGRDVKFFV